MPVFPKTLYVETNLRLWWFQCEMLPLGLGIETLSAQWAALFGWLQNR